MLHGIAGFPGVVRAASAAAPCSSPPSASVGFDVIVREVMDLLQRAREERAE